MALPYTSTPGGIFPSLGRVGIALRDINRFQNGYLEADLAKVINQLQGEAAIAATVAAGVDAGLSAVGNCTSVLQSAARSYLNAVVYADNPQASRSDIGTSLRELIRQMRADSITVKACTVAASSSAYATNTGTGVLVLGTKRGDGLVQENTFAERTKVVCVSDAQVGGLTAGNEGFQFVGDVSQPNVFHREWPLGSGVTASLSAVNGSSNNSTGNLLYGGGFEAFTANVPDRWSIITGTAGTTVLRAAMPYVGTYSLSLVGTGSENTALAQTFNSSSGTTDRLTPSTVYHCSLWAKADVVPGAGVLTLDLVDGSNVATTDAQAVSNSFTCDLTTLSASAWTNFTGEFRTPAVLPSTAKFRLRLSTALTSGRTVYLDNLALARATRLYAGGPFATVFSGATAFVVNDGWDVVFLNDRGGANFNQTFQTLFDRLFGMRALDLLLPSSASPSVADGTYFVRGAELDFSVASNSMYLASR